MDIEKITSRVIFLWIMLISSFIVSKSREISIFRFGPNKDLIILDVCIDNGYKYTIVVAFCFTNSVIRALNHNILQSWIINTIQDKQNNTRINPLQAYEVSITSVIYNWFDFFMYMNILMSQIDMLLIEISADIIMTTLLTGYYLKLNKKKTIQNEFVNIDWNEPISSENQPLLKKLNILYS
jgi:hypothetical protein